jgi:protein phosphatase 2C-like protein
MRRPSWRIASACDIGTSHMGSGTPCQDSAAHAILRTKDGPVLVAAVCDGAGSAAHSEIGSWLASTTFVELVELHFENGACLADIDRDKATAWVTRTAERLISRAGEDGNEPKDYSCTLLAAIVGSKAAAFVQIGDGAIVVSHGEADGWSWVFWPQHGEYANQTTFVLSANAANALDFSFAPRRVDEVAIFSDGIERMVLHGATKAVNEPFFRQMFLPVRASTTRGFDQKLSEKLKGYLGSPVVNARTNDDKTLLMATRLPHSRASA